MRTHRAADRALVLAGTVASALMGVALCTTPYKGAAAGADAVLISQSAHSIPEVQLVRQDERRVSLPQELDDGRPLFVNFIFTSCPGICPLMSESFRQLQDHLGADRTKVHMVSISIDPEQDTPARLREYAERFGAGAQWNHYTGTVDASLAVQRAFGVYNGDKMSHAPITFFRAAPGQPWTELKGFATAADLVRVYKASSRQLATR